MTRPTREIRHPLPQLLKELYAVRDGSAVIGGNGFSFVGGWYPLPIGRAIEAFVRYEPPRLQGLTSVDEPQLRKIRAT